MKNLIMIALVFFAGVHAQAGCPQGQNEATMKVLAETGCPSGLVLLNVETVCVAAPALASLKPNQEFKLCLNLQPDATHLTWEAVVHSAEKVQ